jgi:hypothetical protein
MSAIRAFARISFRPRNHSAVLAAFVVVSFFEEESEDFVPEDPAGEGELEPSDEVEDDSLVLSLGEEPSDSDPALEAA